MKAWEGQKFSVFPKSCSGGLVGTCYLFLVSCWSFRWVAGRLRNRRPNFLGNAWSRTRGRYEFLLGSKIVRFGPPGRKAPSWAIWIHGSKSSRKRVDQSVLRFCQSPGRVHLQVDLAHKVSKWAAQSFQFDGVFYLENLIFWFRKKMHRNDHFL